MADSFTPNFGLCQPEVGSSRDSWGAKLNQDLAVIDQFLGYAMPVGALLDYAGAQAPPGWLICDGRLISRTTYSALFAVLGTYWGAGDGATTFALPNTIGRASVGPGTMWDDYGNGISLSFSQMVGELYYQIQQGHLPNYALYTDVQGYHSHGGATAPGGNHTHSTDVQGYHGHGVNDPGHSHGINDPGHSHYYSMYNIAAIGGYGSNADVVSSGSYPTTAAAGTGISIQGSGVGIGIAGDGNHAHNISYSGNLQLGIYPDGSHQHTIYLGGSSAWFPVIQPLIVLTRIIYAGWQGAAALMVATAAAAAPTIEGVDELAVLREEMAQLRAQIGFMKNPPNPRRLAAPMRGSH